MTGYIQVYTGDGKGKTTAALGLVLRAVGAGMTVYLGQFGKGRATGELASLRDRLPEVTVAQYGRGEFIRGAPTPEDIAAARDGLDQLRTALTGGTFDMVIADEANGAAAAGLLSTADLLDLVEVRPGEVELVFTGRDAPRELMEAADLVTEMKNVKHYYDIGVKARPGIES